MEKWNVKKGDKMTVAGKKAKGRNFQYWVAGKVANLFNIKFNQSDDLCAIHSREMGQSGTDVFIRDKKLYDKFIDIAIKYFVPLMTRKDIDNAVLTILNFS